MTVEEIERWIKKMERLTSRGAKIANVKHLLQISANEIIGEDESNLFQRDPSNEERDIRNSLRKELRKRAGLSA